MIVIYDASVRADRNVYTRFFKISVTLGRNIHYRTGLSASDTLLLTRDADAAAADSDLNEIRSRVSQESESLAVYNITRADLKVIAVLVYYELERFCLTLSVSLA